MTLNAETAAVLVAIASAIGALIASLIMLISNIITTRASIKSEERKYYKGLIINLALENYKEERAMGRFAREQNPTARIKMYPLDDFIIHMSILADMVIDKQVSSKNLEEVLTEMNKVFQQIGTFRDSMSQKE